MGSEPTIREEPPDLRESLREMLTNGSAMIMGNVIDRGNPGLLVATPGGRVVAVYITSPSHVLMA